MNPLAFSMKESPKNHLKFEIKYYIEIYYIIDNAI